MDDISGIIFSILSIKYMLWEPIRIALARRF